MSALESRRRKKLSDRSSTDHSGVGFSTHLVKTDTSTTSDDSLRRRRKRRPSAGNSLLLNKIIARNPFLALLESANGWISALLISFVLSGFIIVLFLKLVAVSPEEPVVIGASTSFRRRYYQSKQLVKRFKPIYDMIYKMATERLVPPDQTNWPEYERRPYEVKSTYGSSVSACDITILLTDPRLGSPVYDYGPGQPLWFALESIGAFASGSCVVLQTSTCAMKEYLGENEESASNEKVESEIVKVIYDNSLPLFRRMMESGRVRIAFLNHAKYNLKSCKDFGNPTPAFINKFFWEDEFIEGVDSDLVLMFQGDAALCYPLDVEGFGNYSFVGGLWPKRSTPLNPDPLEGACLGMSARWKNWLHPQRRWKIQQSNPNISGKHIAAKPIELLPESFPPVCEGGHGPVGNGGLSLRSRRWMLKAVETCPHVSYSGMEVEKEPFPCKVFEKVNEDFYFGTILRAIGAPLPMAFQASLFATEMLWPEQAWELYGVPVETKRDGRGLVVAGRPSVWIDGQRITIPNGVHKPWWYHPNELVRSQPMTNGCPFLPYIFTPTLSRWDEVKQESKPWAGIGT